MQILHLEHHIFTAPQEVLRHNIDSSCGFKLTDNLVTNLSAESLVAATLISGFDP